MAVGQRGSSPYSDSGTLVLHVNSVLFSIGWRYVLINTECCPFLTVLVYAEVAAHRGDGAAKMEKCSSPRSWATAAGSDTGESPAPSCNGRGSRLECGDKAEAATSCDTLVGSTGPFMCSLGLSMGSIFYSMCRGGHKIASVNHSFTVKFILKMVAKTASVNHFYPLRLIIFVVANLQ